MKYIEHNGYFMGMIPYLFLLYILRILLFRGDYLRIY